MKHLLLGIYEDEAGNKLLRISGMRCTNGRDYVSRDIPITICREDGVMVEESLVPQLL